MLAGACEHSRFGDSEGMPMQVSRYAKYEYSTGVSEDKPCIVVEGLDGITSHPTQERGVGQAY